MFPQAKVDPLDCDTLRFLWWPNGELHSTQAEYKMTGHVSGATSSPSCASFCLLTTAQNNKEAFPSKIMNTVKRNFYVDDCLKSVRTGHNARLLVSMLTELLSRAGFSLRKWMSNDWEVLASIPPNQCVKAVVNLDLDKMPNEHALRLQWNVENDGLTFKVIAKERPPICRGIMSVASSVYDPLGFLAPFTLLAKLFLQELCRKKIGWDEEVHRRSSSERLEGLANCFA